MGAITDPPGHPGYGPDVLTVTNPSYAAYLQTTAGKIIAEQAAEIKALKSAIRAANEASEACEGVGLLYWMGQVSEPSAVIKSVLESKSGSPDADSGSQSCR